MFNFEKITMKNFKKISGFTLAEVLVTLTVIGVVAAITIPTLVTRANGLKYRAQFKKAIKVLNDTGPMAQMLYGYDYSKISMRCNPGGTDKGGYRSICSILNGTLTGLTYYSSVANINDTYLDSIVMLGSSKHPAYKGGRGINGRPVPPSPPTIGQISSSYSAYMLADGTIVGFKNGNKNCTLKTGEKFGVTWWMANETCLGFVDVNGTSLPNVEASCGDDSASLSTTSTCTVPNDAIHMTDIYPIVFHDSTVEPATNAGRYVFSLAK
jgi:prepilin-type N-terminal cleavage/methylation domain-containing protein